MVKIAKNTLDTNYTFPVLDNEILREATREERIILYKLYDEIHKDEYIEDGKLVKIEIPTGMIKPVLDIEKHRYIETITKEELMNIRKEKILKYAELKKEIQTLNELESEFESSDTVEMLEEQMKELKKVINKYAEQIEQLKQ